MNYSSIIFKIYDKLKFNDNKIDTNYDLDEICWKSGFLIPQYDEYDNNKLSKVKYVKSRVIYYLIS